MITNEYKDSLSFGFQTKYVLGLLKRDYSWFARTMSDSLQSEFAENVVTRFRRYDLKKSYSKEIYVQSAVMLGTKFDEDITTTAAREILERPEPCYLRLTDLKTLVFESRDKIYGCNYESYRNALQRFSGLTEQRAFDLTRAQNALDEVLKLFPEKARYLSQQQTRALSDVCNVSSAQFFDTQNQYAGAVILFAHVFMLGSGCLDDPVHDYIRSILRSDEADKPRKLLLYGQKRAKAQLRALENTTTGKETGHV